VYDAGQAQAPMRVVLPQATSTSASSAGSGRSSGRGAASSPSNEKRMLAAQQHGRSPSGAGLVVDAPHSSTHAHSSRSVCGASVPAPPPHSNSHGGAARLSPAYSGFAFSHTPSVRVLNLNLHPNSLSPDNA